MKKNKKVIFGVSVFLVLVIVCVFFVYSKNKNTMQTPFDELADTINQKDLGKIPGLFHESCSLSIEEKLSQENLMSSWKLLLMNAEKILRHIL